MKKITLALVALVVLLSGQAWPAGPFGHFLLGRETIRGVLNGSVPAPPELKAALGHPDAQRAFAGGSVGPDICESASHYGKTSDLANSMIADARADMQAAAREKNQEKFNEARRELAFAYGWLSHCGSDLNVHPYVNGMAGDTYRFNNAGQKTIHAAQEAQLTAYLRSLPGSKGEKYDTYVPYEFLAAHTGVKVESLKAGNMKLRGKAMAEIAASDQVTLNDRMIAAWGPLREASLADTARFIGNPRSLGNWDLDCGKLSTEEFNDLRELAIRTNGGKLPAEWGKSYLDWYRKVKGLTREGQEKAMAELLGSAGGSAGGCTTCCAYARSVHPCAHQGCPCRRFSCVSPNLHGNPHGSCANPPPCRCACGHETGEHR